MAVTELQHFIQKAVVDISNITQVHINLPHELKLNFLLQIMQKKLLIFYYSKKREKAQTFLKKLLGFYLYPGVSCISQKY